MATTYELYTNENGTPKAVEGKAPAIIERVENIETSVENFETSIENLDTSIENLETSVETAQATADACLPLSGGTMTGAIKGSGDFIANSRGDNAGYVRVSGGSGFTTGASLLLSGNNMPDYTGKFLIEAANHTNRSILEGRPDGTLTWGNSRVMTGTSGSDGYTSHVRFINSNTLIESGTIVSTATTVKVNFPLPFANTPTVIIQQVDGGNSQSIAFNPSATGFTITRSSTVNTRFCFIAIGEYT